jgi:alpha-1,6-mannosyltransferase
VNPELQREADRQTRSHPVHRVHLVDVTMFWSEHGGGVARYLRTKQDWITRHPGWQHTLLVSGPAAEGRATLKAPPLPFSHGYRMPLNRSRAAKQLVALQPDIIEAGDPYRTAWSALDAGWRLGIPVTAFCHSNLLELAACVGGRTGRALTARYVRRLYRQFDAVFAASRWMVRELHDIGLDNVVYQPLSVDCSLFHPDRADAGWRASLGLAPGDRVLIYAGRFAPEKNLHVLVDAIDKLGDRHVLIAIGDGPTPPRGPRVRCLPYQGDPRALAGMLASVDLFVHAGDQETFGLAALEALACGTPVVACARAGMRDLVDDHVAVGVQSLSSTAYADAIGAMLEQTQSLRAAARRRALAYDHDATFGRLFERYSALRAAITFGESDASGAAHAA